MRRQRWIATIVVTAVLSGAMGILPDSTAAARSHGRSTVTISRHIGPYRCIPAPRRTTVIHHHPWRRRFVRLGPPCRSPVVIYRPVTRHVVVYPLPAVTVSVPTVRIEPVTITMWVTNSNGSRTLVRLRRDGLWYVGPHGEVYTSIPTNEQLRVVYGF